MDLIRKKMQEFVAAALTFCLSVDVKKAPPTLGNDVHVGCRVTANGRTPLELWTLWEADWSKT